MTTTEYHIITVDCPKKMDNGECMAFTDCTSCYGKGRRRMAVWQLLNDRIEMPDLTDFSFSIEDEILKRIRDNPPNSPYHSGDTLPSGEKIGEVMLKEHVAIARLINPAKTIAGTSELLDAGLKGGWLCCAYIKEEGE